ncbi:hypothetical protein B7494_g5640 [Chlorociboria aeruginascens]|nr:hypothetical protein B7494_g5640 [Chlorociboria aeruginascens]
MAGKVALALLVTSLAFVYASNFSPNPLLYTTATASRPIFTVPADSDSSAPLIPNIKDPEAIDAQKACPGYIASNVLRTPLGLTADLSLAGTPCNVYGTDIEALSLTVEYQSSDRLHIEITPTYVDSSNSSWFVLPESLIPKPVIEVDANSTNLDNDINFVWSNSPTFSFTIIRRSTGDVLFSTAGSEIVFEDQFIEFVSPLPENYNLYGLGEVIHGLRLGNNITRTFWAADVGDPIDENIYGTHPFYLDTRYYEVEGETGKLTYAANSTSSSVEYVSYSHGLYMRNAHGQEVLLNPSNITWRVLGGNIDLYFYAGPTQEKITKSYQLSSVGLPAMQQYFTLGYHQSPDWYSRDIAIKTDIDYMNQYRDFENDQNTFSYTEGAKFLSNLHDSGRHYIPIVDSAIYVPNPTNASDAYPVFNRGKDADSFMLNPDGSLYIGSVWPGYTVFPDWVGAVLEGTGAFRWWDNEITTWHQNISFDGIWIDMSEVSSFCVGSCGSNNLTLNPVHPSFSLPGEPGNVIYEYPEGFNLTNGTEAAVASLASLAQAESVSATAILTPSQTSFLRTLPASGHRSLEYPPYVMNNVQGALDVHTVSPNATHHGGTVEYDFHNLFGHQILNATYHALLSVFPTKRPFIIGRSTFAGSGKWAGHWGGDNTSLWAYMFFSIPQALSFSLFGIPFFGVDTCGFGGNTDEELCGRWMQLSAFFPFYRNHNTLSALPQEPYRWASVIDASKTAMKIRYTLLPYMYTTLYLAHKTGSTVIRALAWEFPNDPSLKSADRQFLFGSSLMITPVLVQGATAVNGVFPGMGRGELWYDWYNQSSIDAAPGQNITIDAPLGHIPVYVRGGAVLPTQEPGMTTRECRSNPWGVIAALTKKGTASGVLYVDDGESLMPNSTLLVKCGEGDVEWDRVALFARESDTLSDRERKPILEPPHSRIRVFYPQNFLTPILITSHSPNQHAYTTIGPIKCNPRLLPGGAELSVFTAELSSPLQSRLHFKMSKNVRHKASTSSALKSRGPSKGAEQSSDDGYTGVDLISDSEEEEPDVEVVEEQAIIASAEDELDDASIFTPRPSIDGDQSSWDGSALASQDAILGENTHFFDDHISRMHAPDHDTEATTWNATNGHSEYHTVSETIRRVHFDLSDSSGSGSEIDDIFPDIFLDQSSLHPGFRRIIENDDGVDEQDDFSDDGYWDIQGSGAENAIEESEEECDNSDSSVGSSGYETDEGETTEEDLPPAAKYIPAKSVLRRPSTDSNDSEEEISLTRRATYRKRGGPKLGSWLHDVTKPFAVMDSAGKRLLMYNAKLSRRYSFNGISNRPTRMGLQQDNGSEIPMVDQMSPMIGNSANLMMSAMYTPYDQQSGGQALGPPEAFYPFTSIAPDGTVAQDSPSSLDEDDYDDDDIFDLDDFLNLGNQTDDEDDTGKEGEQGDDSEWPTDEHPSSTPIRPGPTSSEDQVHPLLQHFDSGLVGAFRRNQYHHKLLSRNTISRESLAFAGPHSQGILRGIKGGRLSAVNTPITPVRKQKFRRQVIPSSPGSPLAAAEPKKRKFSGESHNRKRSRSLY